MPKKTAEPKVTTEVLDNGTIVMTEDIGPQEDDSKPAPKPCDADFDWAKEYGTDDLYIHTFSNGTVVALKPFRSIYNKTWLYKLRNAMSADQIAFAAIDRGSCTAAREVLENLPDTGDDLIDELFTAWSSAEGVTPGN